MSDSWESIVTVVVAVLIAYGVVLWLGTVVWSFRDIRARTQDGWTQGVSVALVVLFSIPGLFLYLILRPHETLNEAYERRLEAEALMRDMPEPRPSCPSCQRPVADDFLVCPNCRTHLRQPCAKCARPLELSWSTCPYCAGPGPKKPAPPTPGTVDSSPPPATSQQASRAAPPQRAAPVKNPTPSSQK